MIRTIGIDPGTKSFDIFGLEEVNGKLRVFLEESIESEIVAKEPEKIVKILERCGIIDAIVAPSGYGVKLKLLKELGEEESKLVILVKEEDPGIPVLKGLPKLLKLLKKFGTNIYLIPGIIQLPTIPKHRKINKIDMGTADKLCVTVAAIYDQARFLNINFDETNFILVELGYAYNACIAVDRGKIIDAIGGTNASISFKSLGSMDGELAYLISPFNKQMLFKGGVSDMISSEDPNDMMKNPDVMEAFFEGIEKMVVNLMVSIRYPKEIIISGRLSNYSEIFEEVKRRLRKYAKVRKIEGLSKNIKAAAQGAAMIANGLANGMFKELINNLELDKCQETILDNITIIEKEKLMKSLRSIN